MGWFFAVMGSQMQSVAIGIEVFARTHDEYYLGLVGLCQAIPLLCLAIPAGSLADRFDRRKIAVLSLLVSIGCALTLATAVHGKWPLWVIYATLVTAGMGQAVGWPARQTIIPRLIPKTLFPSAATWNSSAFQIACIVGPVIGGLVANRMLTAAFILYAAGSSFFIFQLLRIKGDFKPEAPAAGSVRPGRWQELLEGCRFVYGTKLLFATILLDLLAVLFGGAVYLLPAFSEALGTGKPGVGWLRAADAVGALSMALWIAHRPPMKRAGRALVMAVLGFGACTVAFALSHNFWLSFAILAGCGACDSVSVVIRHTLVASLAPDQMRGRVAAVNTVFISASNELGGFESGLAAKYMGLRPSVIFGGLTSMVMVAFVVRKFPQIARLGSLSDIKAGAAGRPEVFGAAKPVAPQTPSPDLVGASAEAG
jgi:MFS family permease